MNKVRMYISGGITGVDGYQEHFNQAEKRLEKEGFGVYNPARVFAELPADAPYDLYMWLSIAMLYKCEGVYFLDGWSKSTGAICEYLYARRHDIPMRFENPQENANKNPEIMTDAKYLCAKDMLRMIKQDLAWVADA